jgi:hypothetical protein
LKGGIEIARSAVGFITAKVKYMVSMRRMIEGMNAFSLLNAEIQEILGDTFSVPTNFGG